MHCPQLSSYRFRKEQKIPGDSEKKNGTKWKSSTALSVCCLKRENLKRRKAESNSPKVTPIETFLCLYAEASVLRADLMQTRHSKTRAFTNS